MTSPAQIPGWRHVSSGKVRDIYIPHGAIDIAHADRLLVVASDRISSFDHVLTPEIPGKGVTLTALSAWWFAQLENSDDGPAIRHHVLPDPVPEEVAGRGMIVHRLDMFPIECVVRGYLTGSGWTEYQESRTVCGVALPEGLHDGDRLPQPIFTPAFKAPQGEHDENITFERTAELVGAEHAASLRDLSLRIYRLAAHTAAAHGLILADTKFEFGLDDEDEVTLGDEVLTADSSRYWDAAAWRTGSTPAERMASFDKQMVRDWLTARWDRHGAEEPPALDADIVSRTAARYRELLERLTA